jgi:ATP-binding cassette subfamily F protein 3
MASKDVLKEAIKAFDGTAIVVSHDREFLDGLVTKVYEFGGGKVREHLGGIYDFLRSKQISELHELENSQAGNKTFPGREQNIPSVGTNTQPVVKNQSYAEHKEQQKQLRKAEKAVEQSERRISDMEQRLKELDDLLMKPENASNMEFVTEYTTTKKALDEEVERWEKLSEELEQLTN